MKIKEGMGERKVPRSIGVVATGVVEAGVIGIVVFVAVLGSSRMFVVKKRKRKMMMCKTVKILYQEMTERKEKELPRTRDTYP